MKVAMMQPGFIPWQGLFELIYYTDVFVFLDDFQFSIQSYNQRNRMFVNKGQVDWYTVPVHKALSFKAPLNQTVINEGIPWRKKMWKRIEINYSRAPYYDEIAPRIKDCLFWETNNLCELNIRFIKNLCSILGFNRDFRFSSQLPSNKKRSERVLDLLQKTGADFYLCAKGSFGYMLEDGIFPVESIQVLFQDFQPKPYKQIGDRDFVSHLSVLDALMNVGSQQSAELIINGTEKWLTWQEMLRIYQSTGEVKKTWND